MKFTAEHVLLALAIVLASIVVIVLSVLNHGDVLIAIASGLGGVTGLRALLKPSPVTPPAPACLPQTWEPPPPRSAMLSDRGTAEPEEGEPTMISGDVSDNFLRALAAMASRVGISGHYILEVWNSETGVRRADPVFGGNQYFGPAAVLASEITSQGVTADAFKAMTLEQRLPYLEKLLREQKGYNHGVSPDRPGVLYSINFLPGIVYKAGANPPDSTILAPTGSSYWKDNPLFHPYDDPGGTSVGSMGRRLAHLRSSDARIQELLARYTALTGIPYPAAGGGGSGLLAGGAATGVALIVAAGLALAYAKRWI